MSGVAIDIGTTNIVLREYALDTGAVLREISEPNAQRVFGSDVMTRLSAALSGHSTDLKSLLCTQLRRMLGGLPKRSVAVGNTVMLSLLTGTDVTPLSRSPFSAKELFGRVFDLDGIPIYLPRCARAFLGADLTAAIGASGILDSSRPTLLVDIGTNGEIALSTPRGLFLTSVAAGPAFDRPGLSPSEVISVYDQLPPADRAEVTLAKAAIAAALSIVLEKAQLKAEAVDLILTGAFGGALDLEKAASIGLIPRPALPNCRVAENLALEGAGKMLLDDAFRLRAEAAIASATFIPLAGTEIFQTRYLENMI